MRFLDFEIHVTEFLDVSPFSKEKYISCGSYLSTSETRAGNPLSINCNNSLYQSRYVIVSNSKEESNEEALAFNEIEVFEGLLIFVHELFCDLLILYY